MVRVKGLLLAMVFGGSVASGQSADVRRVQVIGPGAAGCLVGLQIPLGKSAKRMMPRDTSALADDRGQCVLPDSVRPRATVMISSRDHRFGAFYVVPDKGSCQVTLVPTKRVKAVIASTTLRLRGVPAYGRVFERTGTDCLGICHLDYGILDVRLPPGRYVLKVTGKHIERFRREFVVPQAMDEVDLGRFDARGAYALVAAGQSAPEWSISEHGEGLLGKKLGDLRGGWVVLWFQSGYRLPAMEDVLMLQRKIGDEARVVVVRRGLVETGGVRPFEVVDKDDQTHRVYRALGSHVGILVDPAGRVAGPVTELSERGLRLALDSVHLSASFQKRKNVPAPATDPRWGELPVSTRESAMFSSMCSKYAVSSLEWVCRSITFNSRGVYLDRARREKVGQVIEKGRSEIHRAYRAWRSLPEDPGGKAGPSRKAYQRVLEVERGLIEAVSSWFREQGAISGEGVAELMSRFVSWQTIRVGAKGR